MLRVKPLKLNGGSAAGIAEYLTHERKEDAGDRAVGYYSKGESPSRWGGSACDPALVGERVDPKLLAETLEVAGGNHKNARVGFDLSFHPPKSFSIAALTSGSPEIMAALNEAHRLSVDAAMEHVEREVAVMRFGKDGVDSQAATIAWAAFDHEDSRPVDGVADPQKHTHVVVLNMAFDEHGNQRKLSLEFGKGGIPLAGAVYRGALAKRLREMGFELRDGREGWELAKITEGQVKEFSRRAGQIDDKLAERGLDRESATEEQKTAATLGTREEKKQISREAQREEWEARGREQGVELSADDLTPQMVETAILTSDQIQAEIEGLNERNDVFSARELRLALLQEHNATLFSLDAVDAAIAQAIERGQLIELPEGEMIARSSIEREQKILALANGGARKYGNPIRSTEQVAELIAAQEQAQGFEFSKGQREALELALTNEQQVTAIRGYAGAGKTTAMEPAIAAARAAGYETLGLGPSAKAVAELEGAGADRNETLARFILTQDSYEVGEEQPPRMIILDESGMVSSKQMLALLEKLRPQDKLLLVGDDRQLESVEAGQPFAALIKERKVRLAEIDKINRQKVDSLREIAQLYGEGRADEASEKAKSVMTQVPVEKQRDGETKAEALTRARVALSEKAVCAYLELPPDERANTVLLVATNETRRYANEAVRNELQARGEIGQDKAIIDALTQRDLNNRQRAKLRSYHEQDVVQYSTKKGRVSGSIEKIDFECKRLEVRDLKTGELHRLRVGDMKNAQVFSRGELKVGEGDVIQFGQKADLTQGQVINGDMGRVLGIDEEGRIHVQLERKTREGEPVHVVLSQEDTVAADRGFARTVHKSQGMTAQRAIVVAEATRQANANLAYVAMSRMTHSLTVFTNNIETQVKAYSAFSQRKNALDAAREAKREQVDQIVAEVRQEISRQRERQLSR